ncbi:MAG: GreA/GreB family elongation factor [Cyclobacteriaceae bacterium]
MRDTKQGLIDLCMEIVKEKLQTIEDELATLQKSANEETKSSAGDKYETGRAMIMLEKEKFMTQKDQLFSQLKALKTIDVSREMNTVESGAIVTTTESDYFIATGIGQVKLEKENYLVISAMAPIAQAMLGKTVGQKVSFNKMEFTITAIH